MKLQCKNKRSNGFKLINVNGEEKLNKYFIILAVGKDQDLENLLNFYGIGSLKDKFTQRTDFIEDLIKVGLVDKTIFDLTDYYDIYTSNENIELSNLTKKHRDLFENSISPEMLVGIDLILLLGINQKKYDFLIQKPEYKDKSKKFIQSLLLYLKDHQNLK